MKLKKTLRSLTPPLLWDIASKVKRATNTTDWEQGVEQPAEFYDEKFKNSSSWLTHYTVSRYYPMWTVIVDRIKRSNLKKILDIGCGPGQFAKFLSDKDISEYLGIDFSPARLEHARTFCPEYEFVVADVFNTVLLQAHEYDCVLLMEFLEHIEADLEVISRLKPNIRIIATVPSFSATGHVRHFSNVEEVRSRYQSSFDTISVDEHLATKDGMKYFIIDGKR
jgi:trans-aconitate methyltransferase